MLSKRTLARAMLTPPRPAQARARTYGQLTMDVSFSLHKYSFVVILRFHCYCKINIKRPQLNLLCLLQFCLVLQCAGLLIELVSNPNCKSCIIYVIIMSCIKNCPDTARAQIISIFIYGKSIYKRKGDVNHCWIKRAPDLLPAKLHHCGGASRGIICSSRSSAHSIILDS